MSVLNRTKKQKKINLTNYCLLHVIIYRQRKPLIVAREEIYRNMKRFDLDWNSAKLFLIPMQKYNLIFFTHLLIYIFFTHLLIYLDRIRNYIHLFCHVSLTIAFESVWMCSCFHNLIFVLTCRRRNWFSKF